MADHKDSYSKYLVIYFITLAIASLPLIFNYLFLKQSGEFLSPQQIYSQQNANAQDAVIYGSAIFDNFDNVKFYAYAQKKPKVIAFGSSRVLAFRKAFFTQSFYNLGYMAPSIQDGLKSAPKILEAHKPEIVLLGIDFWWFNQVSRSINYEQNNYASKENIIDPAHLLKPFTWIKEGKISFKEYAKITLHNDKVKHLGVKGKTRASGLADDGSMYYTDQVTLQNTTLKDPGFVSFKNGIKTGIAPFNYGALASEIHLKKFLELINLFESHGIKVLLFFPPLAPDINEFMKNYNYAYIDDFMAAKDLSLAPYVNLEYLEEKSNKHFGLAMIPNEKITTKPELDFLCLKCHKY